MLRWNGKTWRAQHAVNPPARGGSMLAAVSCARPNDCIAVGARGGDQGTLAERWNGKTWSIAVGNYTPGPRGGQTMADRWDGASWTRQDSATPPGFRVVYLSSVACPASRACIAVGVKGQQHHTLAERWDGAAWAITPTP